MQLGSGWQLDRPILCITKGYAGGVCDKFVWKYDEAEGLWPENVS